MPTAIKGGTSKRLGVLKRRCDSSEVIAVFSRSSRTVGSAAALSLVLFVSVVGQGLPKDPSAKLLPEKIGDFRATGTIVSQTNAALNNSEPSGIPWSAGRSYVSKEGDRFSVTLTTMTSESAAYAKLTKPGRDKEARGNRRRYRKDECKRRRNSGVFLFG